MVWRHIPGTEGVEIRAGDLIIHDLSQSLTAGASLVTVEVPPDAHHPETRSTLCESLYYCAAGQLDFRVDGEAFAVGTGDLVYVAAGSWYQYRNSGNVAARLISVNVPGFDPSTFEQRQ